MKTDEQVEQMLSTIEARNELQRQHSNSWYMKMGIYIGLLCGGLVTLGLVNTISGIFTVSQENAVQAVFIFWVVGILLTMFLFDRKFAKGPR